MKITSKTIETVNAGSFIDYVELSNLSENKDNLQRAMRDFKMAKDAFLMKKYNINQNYEYNAFSGVHAYGRVLKELAKKIIGELNRLNKIHNFMFGEIPTYNDVTNVKFVTDFVWGFDGYEKYGYLK